MDIAAKIASDIVIFSKYAKHKPELKRRETWGEVVARYENMMIKKYPTLAEEIKYATGYIRGKKVLPSMRMLQFAGAAIEKNHARGYNCSFINATNTSFFKELMFLLLGGTGVGYSVQSHHIQALPKITVPKRTRKWMVGDSIEGWADSIHGLIRAFFHGKPLPRFDYSDVREKGTLLVTAGGKAPGPGPLRICHDKILGLLETKKDGDRLSSVEVSDIACFIADAVLAGGIRRAAMIALFDKYDDHMLHYKSGSWWEFHPERARVNVSAICLREVTTKEEFEKIFKITEASGAGEPGIIWSNDIEQGTNPCAEIALRSHEFCNLTTINLATVESQLELNARVNVASLLGTLQAGFVDFHYLGHTWEDNCKEEALLGISMTGVCDNIKYANLNFEEAADVAVETNKYYAEKIGISKAARVTCIKPEGCQVKDTMVVTDQGILEFQEIGDLSGKQWQEHNFQVNAEKTDFQSTKFFVNGLSKTKKITLNSGLTLEATLNHKYKVLTEDGSYIWKEVADISVGDKIPYRVGGYSGKTKKIFTFNSYLKNKYDATKHALSYPAYISEDIAWFLGLYWGDGSTHKKGIRISGDVRNQEELKRAAEIVFREFGVKHTVCDYSHKDAHDNRCQYYWNSQQFLSFMQENNLLKPKSEDLEIPIWLRKESANIIKAFLDGYGAADGCEVGPCRSFVTVSKKMATQLVVVLRAVGVDCKLREMPPTNSSFGKRMRYWVSERKGRNSDHSKQKKELQNGWKLLDNLGLSNLSFDKVVNIVESENNTYDIEVPDGHTYVANSYISHNTASIVLGTSSGIHGRHAPFYIRRFRFKRNEPIIVYFTSKFPNLVVEDKFDPDTLILELPQKSPSGSIMREEPANKTLERAQHFHNHWVAPGHMSGPNGHNVSVTVSVKEDEWGSVGKWMWENRNNYNGISLLPYDGGSYVQAPFEDCTEETYNKMIKQLKEIDLSEVVEDEDTTTRVQEPACAGGSCEI